MTGTSVASIRDTLASGLGALSYGAMEGQTRVEQDAYDLQSGETIQRLHVPLQGVATKKLLWEEFDVAWPLPIINQAAAGQHESTQDTPHFFSGIEVLTDEHLMIDVQVRAWITDTDTGFYTGAKLRVAVWVPDALKPVTFSAVAHVAFGGYAAAGDDDTDDATNVDPDNVATGGGT